MSVFHAGENESLKAGIHAGLCGLSLVCFTYNVIAFCVRGESHLVRNSIVYGGLVGYELFKIAHHLKKEP